MQRLALLFGEKESGAAAMESAGREDGFEMRPQSGGREGILAVWQDERAGRRSVDIICAIDAPHAVQGGIWQANLRFGRHVVDHAQLVFGKIEGIGRTKVFQPQAFALIVYLYKEMQHIAKRKPKADKLQNSADHLSLLLAADHGGEGKGNEDHGKDGGGYPAALEAEGIEQGKTTKNRSVDANVSSKSIGTHSKPPEDMRISENDSILTYMLSKSKRITGCEEEFIHK